MMEEVMLYHCSHGGLRYHFKSAFSIARRGNRECLHNWGTLMFHLKIPMIIKIYLEFLCALVSHLQNGNSTVTYLTVV